MPENKWLLVIGALMGFISVSAGAFGAHALKQKLSSDMLGIFEIAARYQMYHALAIVLAAILLTTLQAASFSCAGWLFFLGTCLFSGSLYVMALTGIRWLGAITPIGGLILLAGWLCLIIGAYRSA